MDRETGVSHGYLALAGGAQRRGGQSKAPSISYMEGALFTWRGLCVEGPCLRGIRADLELVGDPGAAAVAGRPDQVALGNPAGDRVLVADQDDRSAGRQVQRGRPGLA